jgi:hypothetical protein
VAAQSNGIDERLIAGGRPASDQVPHDRSPVRFVGFREHIQVRRGMVSGALPLGMCCQEVCESLGFADTNRDPAIATAVAPREDINPALYFDDRGQCTISMSAIAVAGGTTPVLDAVSCWS